MEIENYNKIIEELINIKIEDKDIKYKPLLMPPSNLSPIFI